MVTAVMLTVFAETTDVKSFIEKINAGNTLPKRLNKILYDKYKENLIETEVKKLLEEFNAPEEHALIYKKVAFRYANTGSSLHPEKTARYCEKALEYNQEVLDSCLLYGYWGTAIRYKYKNEGRYLDSLARRDIVIFYLKALYIIAKHQTQFEKRELLKVSLSALALEYPNDDPDELRKKSLERKRYVMFQNDLIYYRSMLINQCARLYILNPINIHDMEHLAQEIINNKEIVTELISRVRAKIKEKQDVNPTSAL